MSMVHKYCVAEATINVYISSYVWMSMTTGSYTTPSPVARGACHSLSIVAIIAPVGSRRSKVMFTVLLMHTHNLFKL